MTLLCPPPLLPLSSYNGQKALPCLLPIAMLQSTVVSPSPPKALQLNLGFSSFLATNQNQSRRRSSSRRRRIFISQTRDGSVHGGVRVKTTSTTSSNGWRQSMFVGTKPALEDSILSVSGIDVLTDVPPNVVFTPIPNSSAAFLGATSQNATSQSRHVFKLGVLRYASIYICIPCSISPLCSYTVDQADHSIWSIVNSLTSICFHLIFRPSP